MDGERLSHNTAMASVSRSDQAEPSCELLRPGWWSLPEVKNPESGGAKELNMKLTP